MQIFMYLLGLAIPYALVSAFIGLLLYYFFTWKLVDKERARRIGVCVGIILFCLMFFTSIPSVF